MALGSNVDLRAVGVHQFTGRSLPVSAIGIWQTIMDANGPATQDNAAITNPTTQITDSKKHIYSKGVYGTNLILRLAYDATLTAITNPVVVVFGRTGTDAWQLLLNKSGATSTTITTASTDVSDGTLKYTTPDFSSQAWDCLGCDQLLVGIQTALAGSTGVVTTSTMQAKCI